MIQGPIRVTTHDDMGAITFYNILLFTVIIHVLNVIFPSSGEAITRWNGIFSLEDKHVTTPQSSTNLFQGRINLDVKPATKKRLDARFNVQANYTESDKESIWNVSPIGNLGVDLRGETYSVNVKYSDYVRITSDADLVETKISRAGFSLTPPKMPRFVTEYSTTDTSSESVDTRSDIFSFSSDYRYKWMNFIGGYSKHERFSEGQKTTTSDSLFLGIEGRYEVLPRTTVTGGLDFTQSSSDYQSGFDSTSENRVLRLSVDSRPLDWFGLTGNFTQDNTDSESDTTVDTSNERRNMELTARLYPLHSLQFWTTVGNRKFDDVLRPRTVDFVTVAASFRDQLHENIQVGLNVSRTTEKDPDQGENIRDNFGFNSTMDLTPRISARVNLNIGRSEMPGFISEQPPWNQEGTLVLRDSFDDEQAGFIFYDNVNNELYTKNSIINGDWSDPVHLDPITEQFTVSKTALLNMTPTDKTSLVLSYTSNSSADRLDIAKVGNQSVNSSFTYRPNLRTSYSLTGIASLPQTGDESYAGTLTMAYRFFRDSDMNLSYSRRYFSDNTTDNFSSNFRFSLRKKATLDMTYSTSQILEDDQTHFFSARYSKYF